MHSLKQGLGVKNISDLIIKERKGIFDTRKPILNQIKQYKMSLANLMNNHSKFSNQIKYAHSDLMEKIIKNCREVKKSNRNNTNREILEFF